MTHRHALPCDCGLLYHLVLDTTELVGVFKEFSSVLFCSELRQEPFPWVIEEWLFTASNHVRLTSIRFLLTEVVAGSRSITRTAVPENNDTGQIHRA
jgi:hypothetical protein